MDRGVVLMALPFATDDLVFLRAPKVKDAYGSTSRKTKDWANAMRATPVRGVAQPDAATLGASLATKEDHSGGREQIETTQRVWVDDTIVLEWIDPPAGADTDPWIKETDGVEVDGRVYALNGEALAMPDPIGGLGHLVMKAIRVKG
ncbi:hypothetical protein GCM10023224_05100 [Streptomonospora halophila]|uniref:Head-to-tail stopper n=1 Tax=Streptomonospora halophila TaxID=427369 RepID=A0ABP9G515_9ACTN